MNRTLPILLVIMLAAALFCSHTFVYQTLSTYFFFFPFALGIIFYCGILLFVKAKSLQLRLSYPVLFFVLWGIYIFVNGYLKGRIDNLDVWYLLICILLFLSLSILFSCSTLLFRWFYSGVACLAFLEALVCIGQYLNLLPTFNQYFAVTGTQVNPNVTAMFLAMATGSFIPFFSPKKPKKNSFLFWPKVGMGACVIVALGMLHCRSAWLGAGVSVMVVLCVRWRLWQWYTNKTYRLRSIFITIVAVFVLMPVFVHTYKSKQASTDGRKLIWKISLQLILQKPMMGYGYGMFEPNYNRQQASYFESGKATKSEIANAGFVNMAYNEALQNAVEGGFFGLLLFIAGMMSLLIAGFKRSTEPCIADKGLGNRKDSLLFNSYIIAFAGICSFSIMSLINFTVQASSIMLLWVIYGAIVTSYPLTVSSQPRSLLLLNTFISRLLPSKLIKHAGLGVFFLVVVVWLSLSIIPHIVDHIKLKQGMDAQRQGETNRALGILIPLKKTMCMSECFLQNYGQMVMSTGNYHDALSEFEKATYFTADHSLYMNIGWCYQNMGNSIAAEENYRLVLNMAPARFAPRYTLMRLYADRGDTIQACGMARSIVQLKPKVPSKEVHYYKHEASELMKKLKNNGTIGQ